MMLIASIAWSDIIEVPGDYPTIQAGIDAAVDGDTVLVANGIWTGDGNKNLDFGGKAITVTSENGAENCIINCEGDGRGFYFGNGEGENSEVSGFTITNGFDVDGGGLYCYNASPTITNCIISGNTADDYGGGIHCYNASPTITDCTIGGNTAEGGGGIECYDHSSPVITNCTITGNTAWLGGGGIECYDHSSPTITNCTINSNTPTGTGGGIYCYDSSPTITDCTISGHQAWWGGGICCSRSSPTIVNCTISGNTADDYGGGIYCYDSSPTITDCTISGNAAGYAGGIYCCNYSDPTITNCIITDNMADFGYGGGISCWRSSPTITNCTISGNTAEYDGGGIECGDSSPTITKNLITKNSAIYGAGIFCSISSAPVITNNLIAGNSADYGAGISCDNSFPVIINNTITKNFATSGGGIWSLDSSPTVLNTILWGDKPEEIVGSAIITYSDVQGGWPGEGNIDADPLFVDPDNDDYHLQPGSPCIDAGTPDGAPPDDIEGNPRDEFPDMGAYEYVGTGTISGYVTDCQTGKPVKNVIIIATAALLPNPAIEFRFWTLTDEDGYYEIDSLKPGKWWVIGIKRGYKFYMEKIEVPTTHDFCMENR